MANICAPIRTMPSDVAGGASVSHHEKKEAKPIKKAAPAKKKATPAKKKK
jgi:hypothetical protein